MSTVLPDGFFKRAVSPSLFQTYQPLPQYTCRRLSEPEPVWTVTVRPGRSRSQPNRYLCPAPSVILHSWSCRALDPAFLMRIHSLLRLALLP